MLKLYTIDEHAMKCPKINRLITLALVVTLCMCLFLGVPLYQAEVGSGNISSYPEAVWNVWITITTIGYGDFYPTSLAGQILTLPMYLMSAFNFGVILACVGQYLGLVFPTVAVREIRSIVSEILRILQQFDIKGNKVTVNSNNLDNVNSQWFYRGVRGKGIITRGLESSGIHCVSVDVIHDGNVFQRWHLCTDEAQALELEHSIRQENEYDRNNKPS